VVIRGAADWHAKAALSQQSSGRFYHAPYGSCAIDGPVDEPADAPAESGGLMTGDQACRSGMPERVTMLHKNNITTTVSRLCSALFVLFFRVWQNDREANCMIRNLS
jgi:hypothetical protein